MLTGDAGLGKSALCELAGSLAIERGALVLVATPGEGEERYSFSVLLDLLRDVDLAGVPLSAAVRGTLETVLLRGAGSGPVDPHVVSIGTLDVLSHLADGRQVVLLVDDVQWADPASMESLAFAARRPAQAPVQLVLARRAGFARSRLEAALARSALRYVEPRPLTREETARPADPGVDAVVEPARAPAGPRAVPRATPCFALEVGRRSCWSEASRRSGETLGVPVEMATMLGLRVRDLARRSARCCSRSRSTRSFPRRHPGRAGRSGCRSARGP